MKHQTNIKSHYKIYEDALAGCNIEKGRKKKLSGGGAIKIVFYYRHTKRLHMNFFSVNFTLPLLTVGI